MAAKKQFLFVSYAREDYDRIQMLVGAVEQEIKRRALPLELWIDIKQLAPGEQWEFAIRNALESSVGFMFFISASSLRSEWIKTQLEFATVASDRLIIPIKLDPGEITEFPDSLKHLQYVRFWAQSTPQVSELIVDAIESFLRAPTHTRKVVSNEEAPLIAAEIAEQVRASEGQTAEVVQQNSVFIVHGHNIEVLENLESYLASTGIEAIVLSKQDESPQSLFQKFMLVATKARFAIVLLGADDYGASRRQYDAPGVGDRSLQFRARQNVIMELGFFYGRLGWEHVFVMYYEPALPFPNFERPSDLDGIIFNSFSDPAWQMKLGKKLSEAGFKIPPVIRLPGQ